MTVIRGMTLDAARMMDADRESGSIAEGKFADVSQRTRNQNTSFAANCT